MDAPPTLKWVTQRAKCSLAVVFEALAENVESDAAEANALGRQGVTFQFNRPAQGRFLVARVRDFGGVQEADTIVFALAKAGIRAERRDPLGAGRELFVATPRFNAQGECLLHVAGEDLRLWQVSRLALEDLFFGF